MESSARAPSRQRDCRNRGSCESPAGCGAHYREGRIASVRRVPCRLLLPLTLVAKRQSATVDLLHSTDLVRNVFDTQVWLTPRCCFQLASAGAGGGNRITRVAVESVVVV
jgi:hypothetical protein